MIRLAIRCRPEHADEVLAELLELCPGGVEEEQGRDYVEYAIYGPPGEVPAVPELEAAAGAGLVEIGSTEVPDDWADNWRDFHTATVIAAGRLTVRPSWIEPGRATTGIYVVVDPGQAFGTGAHATTRMCLELLVDAADAGWASGPMTDLGTGSGVLAICAAKLGWSPVAGYDHEPAALEAAAGNARANDVAIDLGRLNLRQELPACEGAVIANLTAPLLLGVAARLGEPRPRLLICSGLLTREVDDVVAAFARAGLGHVETRDSGEWAAIRLEGS